MGMALVAASLQNLARTGLFLETGPGARATIPRLYRPSSRCPKHGSGRLLRWLAS